MEYENEKKLPYNDQLRLQIEILWHDVLPWAEPPQKWQLASWLRIASVDQIVELMQKCAQREDVHNPAGFIWCRLSRRQRMATAA